MVLEAAACGTPSIVSDAGGLAEAALGLDASLVVAAGDAQALAARLLDAARGEGLLARGKRRASYAERFSAGRRSWQRHRRALPPACSAGERDAQYPRVVYLDHVARLSGGEIALLRVLPHMRGVNAHVILGEDGPFASRLQQAGISVEVLAIAPSAPATCAARSSARAGGAPLGTALETRAGYTLRRSRSGCVVHGARTSCTRTR